MYLLRGGRVVSGRTVVHADVLVEGRTIVDVAAHLDAAGAEVLDVAGCHVTPGYIDLQVNGGFGVDVTTEPTRLGELAARLPAHGVTAFCPTVVSAAPSRRAAALDAWAALVGDGLAPGAAVPVGLHLEGPVLNPARRGAHPPLGLDPAPPDTARWTRAAGVAMVTLAPELPGALDLVRRLTGAGVVVAAGHTDATADEMTAAADAGLAYVTHLFNAMRPFAHRDPGVVGVALTDDRLTVGLIADGIHVHPNAVRLAWRVLGPGRANLVSDAVAVTGMADGTGSGAVSGRVRVGGVELTATPAGVREPGGALAGTDLTLDRAVAHLVGWTGCPLADAVATVTEVPARLLGLAGRGAVVAGNVADLVVLDPELRVRATMVGGHLVDANMRP